VRDLVLLPIFSLKIAHARSFDLPMDEHGAAIQLCKVNAG